MEHFIGQVTGWGFFIYMNLISNNDRYIADALHMTLKEYQNYLIKHFNATIQAQDAYFVNREDVENALEWIDSIFILNKMNDKNG